MDKYELRLYRPDNSYEKIEIGSVIADNLIKGRYKQRSSNPFDCYEIYLNGEYYRSGILKWYGDIGSQALDHIIPNVYLWVEEIDGDYKVFCSQHRVHSPINFEWRSTFKEYPTADILYEIKENAQAYIKARRDLILDHFKRKLSK